MLHESYDYTSPSSFWSHPQNTPSYSVNPSPASPFPRLQGPHFTSPPQIIILSAVTKEIHTPSITMHKFSVRRFGRVLIKKPFHLFSWEIIRLSSHQDAKSKDPFFCFRKTIGKKNTGSLTTFPRGHHSIIKYILGYKKHWP